MKVNYLSIFFLLITNIFTQDSDEEYLKSLDSVVCAETESRLCQNTKLSGGRLCCEVFEKNGDEIQETCEMKTTKQEQNLIVGSSRIINKELGGIAIYNEKYGGTVGSTIEERKFEIQRTITITCKTWDFSVNIIDGIYTNKEIKLLSSDQHCLSYFNPYLIHTSTNRREVNRDICYGAALLKSTRDEGINCGYMEIEIIEPGATETRQTCFLFDPKVLDNKVLDEATRLNLNAMSKKNENNNIKYNFVIYGPQGKGYKYDSETRIVEEVQDQSGYNYSNVTFFSYDDVDNGNNGYINKISICFLILINLFLL